MPVLIFLQKTNGLCQLNGLGAEGKSKFETCLVLRFYVPVSEFSDSCSDAFFV